MNGKSRAYIVGLAQHVKVRKFNTTVYKQGLTRVTEVVPVTENTEKAARKRIVSEVVPVTDVLQTRANKEIVSEVVPVTENIILAEVEEN